MSEVREIKASVNNVQVVGVLNELNMEEVIEETNIGTQDKPKKVNCAIIRKKEFKNPSMTIELNGNIVEVNFFDAKAKKLDENGNVVDNDRYKAMKTILENYVPKIKDAENATRVSVKGSLRANEYVGQDDEWKSFPSISAFQCSSTGVPEEDMAEGEISGVVKSIIPETKTVGEDVEETGRIFVEFYSFDKNGATTPIKFVVESDIAEDFKDMYPLGTNCKLLYDITTKQVGAKKAEIVGGFGRKDRESKITSGFSVTEYSVFRGTEPFEEENDFYVSIEDMKKALKERDLMIEQKKKDKKENGNGKAKSGGLGNRESKLSPADNTENPFL